MLEYIKEEKQASQAGVVSEEDKIELVLGVPGGWERLARTMRNSSADDQCRDILTKIAGDTEVVIPFGNIEVSIPLIDVLIAKLNLAVLNISLEDS